MPADVTTDHVVQIRWPLLLQHDPPTTVYACGWSALPVPAMQLMLANLAHYWHPPHESWHPLLAWQVELAEAHHFDLASLSLCRATGVRLEQPPTGRRRAWATEVARLRHLRRPRRPWGPALLLPGVWLPLGPCDPRLDWPHWRSWALDETELLASTLARARVACATA